MKTFIFMILCANLALVFGCDESLVPSPLGCAINEGQEEIVREIVGKNSEVLNTKIDGDLPIHIAARYKKENMVKYFLDLKPDLTNAKNDDGETPLFLSASSNGPESLIKYLISKGADVNAKDKYESTPLHSSVKLDYESVAKLLIENKADINATNFMGLTPLHFAAKFGYKNMAKLLVENGADINVRAKDNKTPCDSIQEKHREAISPILKCTAQSI